MDESLIMGELERFADLRNDLQGLTRRKFAGCFDLPQIRSVHIFHEEIVQAIGPAKVIYRDDIRVTESGQRARFAGEAFREAGVVSRLRGKNLERDQPI